MVDGLDVPRIAQLLSDTLNPDVNVVRASTEALDRLSQLPHFPLCLLSIAAGGKDQGQRIAGATYLKNFSRRNIQNDDLSSKVSKEFKVQLLRTLLRVEPPVLKVLVEVFRAVAVSEFVKKSSWPELLPDLRSAIESSNLICSTGNADLSTISALTILQALLRPYQYFLNPKEVKEQVPSELELIANEILVPLLSVFHYFVRKVVASNSTSEVQVEKLLLVVCKCMYFAVRSYMPSSLVPLLPSFCQDLIAILGSLSLECASTLDDGHLLHLKCGKRSLLIFCTIVTRHRKISDKLMPEIITSVLRIVKFSKNICKLDFLSERIVSLGFDVVAHILETGPGWRIVSPHFMSLLETAIFPALVMNKKDIAEWEEDADEYIRKNLPSDIDEVSGWREDLFTARKSALNLLGVISMSKGPPTGNTSNGSSATSKRKKGEKNKRKNDCRSMGELLVLPFLSKFPIPSDANSSQTSLINDYYGVLMAYGGLQDFLREQQAEYVNTVLHTRVLPLYRMSLSQPYLIANANWILGELACCLPNEKNGVVYSALLKALAIPDKSNTSCYPVRVSAAGAIAALLENDYTPPEWLPLLQVVVGNIGNNESEDPIFFQLLSSVVEAGDENVAFCIPEMVVALIRVISKYLSLNKDSWPQVVVRGLAALAMMAQTWEKSVPKELEGNETSETWIPGRVVMSRSFAALLQQAWLTPKDMEDEISPSSICTENFSTLLWFIILSIRQTDEIQELRVVELLSVWGDLIAEWHAWEESEDLAIFDCIREVIRLNCRYKLSGFLMKQMPAPPAAPVPDRSIIEGIGTFVSEAILQYPSATWRACSCVHLLLHCPNYSYDTEGVKQSLVISFSRVAFSRFNEVKSKPCPLWKPLLLAISSCYLCYPEIVEGILEKVEDRGFAVWASSLCHVSSRSSDPGLIAESEMKLMVMVLTQLIERWLTQGNPGEDDVRKNCFVLLLDVYIRLNEAQQQKEDEESALDVESDEEEEEEEEDSDEDSEAEELEETEEEFLNRYAKAAAALENGSFIEEGEDDDQAGDDIELGDMVEIDLQGTVTSLIQKYRHILVQGQQLPSEIISNFLNAIPECVFFFQ